MPRGPDYQRDRTRRQEDRILAVLAEGPATAYTMAEKLFISRSRIHFVIKGLMKRPNKRVYIADFDFDNVDKSRAKYVYALGSSHNLTIEKYREREILHALEGAVEPLSTRQITALVSVKERAVVDIVKGLREKERIHVEDWGWSGKTPVPLYVFGKGKSAPRPTSRPESESKRIIPQTIFAALFL